MIWWWFSQGKKGSWIMTNGKFSNTNGNSLSKLRIQHPYMYVYIYMYIYICIYMYVYIYIYTYVILQMCIYIYRGMYIDSICLFVFFRNPSCLPLSLRNGTLPWWRLWPPTTGWSWYSSSDPAESSAGRVKSPWTTGLHGFTIHPWGPETISAWWFGTFFALICHDCADYLGISEVVWNMLMFFRLFGNFQDPHGLLYFSQG